MKNIPLISDILNKHITKLVGELEPNDINDVMITCCCNDIMTEVVEVREDKRIIVLSVEVPRFPMVDDDLFETVHKMADGELEYQFDYLGKRNPTPK